jgi:ATP-dependent DNA helicase RecG
MVGCRTTTSWWRSSRGVASTTKQEPTVDGLDTAIGASGLPGAASLRRNGRRMGIETVRDLLVTFPRSYRDLRELTHIKDLAMFEPGTPVTIKASVVSISSRPTYRRRLQVTTAVLREDTEDGNGMGATVEAVWFGRRFIERQLKPGDEIVASGKVKLRDSVLQLDNPEFQRTDDGDMLHAGRIVPIYRLTRGVTAKTLRRAIRAGLDDFGPYAEYLPAQVVGKLSSIGDAVAAAHYPDDFDQRDAALHRLAHDELLALQLGMVARRRQRREAARPSLQVDDAVDVSIRRSITAGLRRRVGGEVALTDDQERAMTAVRGDMEAQTPMLRLIQGDVGSGKTAVAAHMMALVALAGGQAALLAPTDLLARQLAGTVGDLLADVALPVTLLTGSLSSAGRKAALEAIASGQAQIVVGTHALLQESVSYARLDAVVVDEQHRFGVSQREALAAKGQSPHVLLMTATPIPRTLGQVLYADLDVSDLHTAPAGRPVIATGIRKPNDLEGAWGQVRMEAEGGQRTFVVVPHIDPQGSDDGETEIPVSLPAEGSNLPAATGAEEVAQRLRDQLAPLRVGLVHGRMRADDREAEMSRFRDGDLDVLVGTTVVEVGVDVPEATMMVVLTADRFGLSQLHQLRGRVGRGTAASYCVLVADVQEDTTAWSRLTTIRKTQDGFVLAEKDWELRGEGDVLGLTQSGLPRLRVASLAHEGDRELAVHCRELAESMLDDEGLLPPRLADLEKELETGWLAGIAAGEAASEDSVGA